MEPNNSIQPTISQPLDNSVVALTKAIGKAESGGDYNAPDNTGDGAASSGAYQMTPGFLKKWGPSAGIQYSPDTKLTPAQQDEIAYTAVKTMGTTGDPSHPSLGKLKPAQIVSAWNTGDPNAYLDSEYGKNNTYGSTQNYVNKVSEYYKQFGGGEQSQPQTSNQQIVDQGTTDNQTQDTGKEIALGAGGLAAGGIGATLLTGGEDLLGGAENLIAGIGPAIGSWLGLGGGGGGNNSGNTGGNDGSGGNTGGESSASLFGGNLGKSAQAQNLIENAINQTLQGTQTGRNFSSNPQGQNSISAAAMFGLINPDENGFLTVDKQKRQQLLQEVANLDDKAIAADGGVASPLAVSNHAGTVLSENKLSTSSDRKAAAKIIQDELSNDLGGIPMNGQMSLSDMREREKQHNAAASAAYKEGNYTPTPKHLAHKALGKAYGRAIEDSLKDPGAKELHQRAKKMEQALIRTRDLDKHVQGKRPPKKNGIWESFLRQGARAAEIYIGDKLGGPIGAIIGGIVGEHINQRITKKYGRNIFETKGMKAALDILHDTKPQEFQSLIAALKKQGIEVPQEEITGKPGVSPEEAIRKAGKKKSIVEMDSIVNEIQQSKKGLVSREKPYTKQKPKS